MKLIDADKLEEQLREKMRVQEEVAKQYNVLGGTFVQVEKGIMREILELVKKQEEVKI